LRFTAPSDKGASGNALHCQPSLAREVVRRAIPDAIAKSLKGVLGELQQEPCGSGRARDGKADRTTTRLL